MRKKGFMWKFAHVALLLAFVASSCSDDSSLTPSGTGGSSQLDDKYVVPTVSEKGFEEHTETTDIKLKDNVTYVREDLDKYIEEYDEEKGIISFREGAEEIISRLNLKAGDVLYCTLSTEKHPDGFCVVITDTEATRAPFDTPLKFNIEPYNFLAIHEEKYMCEILPDPSEVKLDSINMFDPDFQYHYNPTELDAWHIFEYEGSNKEVKLNSLEGKYSVKYGKTTLAYDKKTSKYTLTYNVFKHDDFEVNLVGGVVFEPIKNDIVVDEGWFDIDGDIKWGVSLAVELKEKGSVSSDDPKIKKKLEEKLKQFEKEMQLVEIPIPFSAASSLIVRPKFEVKVRFKFSGSGKLTLEGGLQNGEVTYHFANAEAYSTDLAISKVEKKYDPSPYFKAEGSVKGEASLGIPIGLKFEIPALKYHRKKYDTNYYTTTVNSWADYKTREKETSYIGFYLMPELSGEVSLSYSADNTGAQKLKFSIDPEYNTYAVVSWLFGWRGHLFSNHEHREGLHKPLKLKNPWEWSLYNSGGIFLSRPISGNTVSPVDGAIRLDWAAPAESGAEYTLYVGYFDNKDDLRKNNKVETTLREMTYQFKPSVRGKHYWFVEVKNPSGVKYESDVECFNVDMEVADQLYTCPDDRHPHAIPMDVVRGLYVSCCNLGASEPTDPGKYFSWGSTTPVSDYQSQPYTKPDTDFLTGATDAATTLWDAKWHMPSIADMEFLLRNCKWEWKGQGAKVTSPTTFKSIYLPAGGFYDPYRVYNEVYGSYWGANSENSRYGSEIIFGVVDGNHGFYRCDFYADRGKTANYNAGRSIRPVTNIAPLVKW